MTIYAWTAPGANYPAYVNVSDATDERGNCTIAITVRGPMVGDKPGETVAVTLPSDEWAILVGHLKHNFDTFPACLPR